VKLRIDRHHQHIYAANLSDGVVAQRAIITEVDDPKAANLKQPNSVALAEFLAPRVRVFPGISDCRDVANLVSARMAQNESCLRPGNLPAHGFTAVVVVMWVRNQDGLRVEAGRKVVSQPNPTCVRIEQDLFPRRRRNAEARLGDVLNRHASVVFDQIGLAADPGRLGGSEAACKRQTEENPENEPLIHLGDLSDGAQFKATPDMAAPGKTLTRSGHSGPKVPLADW